MKRHQLLHPVFISALWLLVANDVFLKYYFHNWLTGKLSDFAGLFVFTVFLISFAGNKKKMVAIAAGLFFCWWKSSLSSPVIRLWNSMELLPVYRTIDYTDLLALSVIPLAYRWLVSTSTYRRTHHPVAINLVSIACIFAFCNTSVPYREIYTMPANQVRFHHNISVKASKEDVLNRLTGAGYTIEKRYVKYYPARHADYVHKISVADSTTWQPVINTPDTALYVRLIDSTGFYVIPEFVTDTDTLYDLTFSLYSYTKRNKVFTDVTVQSFRISGDPYYHGYAYGKKKRQLKKQLGKLFSQ